MNNSKLLKRLLIVFIVLLVVIIFVSRQNAPKRNNDNVVTREIDIDEINNQEVINYNNLTESEQQNLLNVYGENVAFTNEGVKLYAEKAYSGKPYKTITSTWPEIEIANNLPSIDFGTIEKIEYGEKYIYVYVVNTNSKDQNNYIKALKNNGYTQKSKEEDGAYATYFLENENGNMRLDYIKYSNRLQIIFDLK